MSLVLKTPADPGDPILTLEEVKDFLRVEPDVTDEDSVIERLRDAVVQTTEQYTNRAFGVQTWLQYLCEFPETIKLQRAPVTEITSIKYYDTDGAQQMLSPSVYLTVLTSEPARIVLQDEESWPDTQEIPNAVEVEFDCGYSDTTRIPEPLKLWMLRGIGFFYENRGATELPQAFLNELFTYNVQV